MNRNESFTLDTVFDFGKHKGKSLSDIIENDIDYIIWCILNIEQFKIDCDSIIFFNLNKKKINGGSYLDVNLIFENEKTLIANKFENVIKTNNIKSKF